MLTKASTSRKDNMECGDWSMKLIILMAMKLEQFSVVNHTSSNGSHNDVSNLHAICYQ